MTSTEYYQRAAADAAFRQHSLESMRLLKHLSVAFMIVCAVAAIALSVYGGVQADKWDSGYGLVILAAFSWVPYLCCSARLGALERMQEAEMPVLR